MAEHLRPVSRGLPLLTAAVALVWLASPAGAVGVEWPDIVGETETYIAGPDDTLAEIAMDNGFGFTEMLAANPGIDPWLPPEGTPLILPRAHILPDAPREGVVINLGDQRLYVFDAENAEVRSYPMGVGRTGRETPLGRTAVVRKGKDPAWYPPASIRAERPWLPAVVPPGPDNPLGRHALYLGWASYLIHGTNRPLSIGRRVSAGCIRLYPEDVATLFDSIPVGTQVTVVDQPVKLGWRDGALWIQAHPSQDQADAVEAGEPLPPEPAPGLAELVRAKAGDAAGRVDWTRIGDALEQRRGVPVRITH